MIDEKIKSLDEAKHDLLKYIEKTANVMSVLEGLKMDMCNTALRIQHSVLHAKEKI